MQVSHDQEESSNLLSDEERTEAGKAHSPGVFIQVPSIQQLRQQQPVCEQDAKLLPRQYAFIDQEPLPKQQDRISQISLNTPMLADSSENEIRMIIHGDEFEEPEKQRLHSKLKHVAPVLTDQNLSQELRQLTETHAEGERSKPPPREDYDRIHDSSKLF